MPDKRDLRSQLIAADRSLAHQRLPPVAVQRIANAISRELDHHPRSRWIPMATFVAGAALVLVFLSYVGGVGLSAQDEGPTSLALQTVVSGADCHRDPGEALRLRGACEVVMYDPGIRIQTIARADFSIEAQRMRVHQGSVLFDFDKVVGEPIRVHVPGGEIVVVGTRFRVMVDGAGGQVDLYEGRLEFRADDGTRTPIGAGQTFEFGRAHATVTGQPKGPDPRPPPPISVPAAEPDPRSPAAPSGARPKQTSPRPHQPTAQPATQLEQPSTERDAGALIEEVQQLERQGEYARAATVLERALDLAWPDRTGDVLSNELGRILARRLGDRDRACEHWARHLRRFPSTRYRRQIDPSIVTLGCAEAEVSVDLRQTER